VTVNGGDKRVTPLDRPFVVSPGHVTVEVTADGYEKFAQELDVGPGVSAAVDAALKAVPKPIVTKPVVVPVNPTVVPHDMPAPVGIAKTAPARYAPWQWVAIGTGAAMVITGAVLSAVAAKDRANVANAGTLSFTSVSVSGMTRANALSLQGSANRMTDASVAMYTIGGAAVVSGVVLAIMDAKKSPNGKTRAAPIAFSAAPTPGGAVVGATGRFW
jgi:hypothetical protein